MTRVKMNKSFIWQITNYQFLELSNAVKKIEKHGYINLVYKTFRNVVDNIMWVNLVLLSSVKSFFNLFWLKQITFFSWKKKSDNFHFTLLISHLWQYKNFFIVFDWIFFKFHCKKNYYFGRDYWSIEFYMYQLDHRSNKIITAMISFI